MKYTIKHYCGHEQVHDIYDKSKIEWLEGVDCTACWLEAKKAKEDAMPITVKIETNGIDTDDDGDVIAYIVLTGGTRPRKDEIKTLGYFWGERRGDLLEITFGKKPSKVWQRTAKLISLLDEKSEAYKRVLSDAQALNAEIEVSISPMDAEAARRKIAEREKIKKLTEQANAEIAQIEKPKKPNCHPTKKEGYVSNSWNGKYYGSDSNGWCYYANDKKYNITNEEHKLLTEYSKQYKAYKEKCEEVLKKYGLSK